MKFLICLSLLLAAANADLSQHEKQCVDSAFEKKPLTSPEDIKFCEKFFGDKKAAFRASFEQSFGCDYNDKNILDYKSICDPECFIKAIDDYKIADLYMIGLISHLHSGLNDSYAEDDGDSYEDRVRFSVRSIKVNIALHCMDSKLAALNVDEMVKHAKSYPEAYRNCFIRYAVDKNFINPADYNLDMSHYPTQGCSSVFANLDEEQNTPVDQRNKDYTYFGVTGLDIKHCVDKHEITTSNFVWTSLFKVRAISMLNLTPEKRTNLENFYMQSMKSFVSVVLDCTKNFSSSH